MPTARASSKSGTLPPKQWFGYPAAEALGREGIYTWDGDFYATGLIERLGKAETGGVLRLGLVHYNTADEVDRTMESLERIAG